ncbi:hypothetical protein VTG60DRAFT_223 [Thermothelomyces hinnuleus]
MELGCVNLQPSKHNPAPSSTWHHTPTSPLLFVTAHTTLLPHTARYWKPYRLEEWKLTVPSSQPPTSPSLMSATSTTPTFDREPPPGGYPQGEEDTEAVLGVLRPLVEAGKKVLLVGHSSGGWVATQAARHDLQAPVRRSKGLAGGVIGIFYAGAFVIPVGESIHSFFQPKDGSFVTPPFMTFHKHGAAGLGTIVNAEHFLFNDLDADSAKQWAATLTASPVMTTKLSNNAYSALPCAYLFLDGDLTLPREYQEGMASFLSSQSGDTSIYYCPAGHSPHLSWIEGMVDTIPTFVEKITTESTA